MNTLFDKNEMPDDSPDVWSVSELTSHIKHSLESRFPNVWVSGEISNLSRPRSGHLYFDLKDEQAVVKSVVWRSQAARLRFDLEDGQQVIGEGNLDVYPPHGTYKLILRRIEPVGVGALQKAFEQLHQRLAAEGLFAPELKKPLPRFPSRVAIVTSPTGAAVHDFVQTLRRRWPLTRVLIIPARVQGAGAAEEIVDGIQLANLLRPKLDLVVVGRGGGSLEDLWAFNEEPVIRAIHASSLPVVSAVGHEVDVTLSDLVADVRALTPTAAAELIVPSQEDVRNRILQCGNRLCRALERRYESARQRLDALGRHPALRRPLDIVHRREERLDELSRRAEIAMNSSHERACARVATLSARLEAISPVGVLGRGYSVVQTFPERQVLKDTAAIKQGDAIECRFAKGSVEATVTKVHEDEGE